ncbi:hypothetical protein FS749_015103 [Ceratobasidium sp. UAMH 11750]|nr:hypothetical protein FS749_015103 [Ceratobasidium sp. UAMH 11750]
MVEDFLEHQFTVDSELNSVSQHGLWPSTQPQIPTQPQTLYVRQIPPQFTAEPGPASNSMPPNQVPFASNARQAHQYAVSRSPSPHHSAENTNQNPLARQMPDRFMRTLPPPNPHPYAHAYAHSYAHAARPCPRPRMRDPGAPSATESADFFMQRPIQAPQPAAIPRPPVIYIPGTQDMENLSQNLSAHRSQANSPSALASATSAGYWTPPPASELVPPDSQPSFVPPTQYQNAQHAYHPNVIAQSDPNCCDLPREDPYFPSFLQVLP